MLKGIDVSVWQGSINWAAVKPNVDFAILRAGYGRVITQKDKRFEEYYAGCKANGIPVGIYWYSYAHTKEEAALEAKVCAECLKGKQIEYPILFDIEESSQANKSIADAIITGFCDTLKSMGYYVGIYTYYSFIKSYISKSVYDKYDLAIAHYASSTPWQDKEFWQYSSKGRIPGINGDVDLDYCYVDNYPEKIKAAGLNGFTATETKKEEAKTETPAPKPVAEATKPAQTPAPSGVTAGQKLSLNNTSLYASANAGSASGKKTGTFYVYSTEVVNGRVRITNTPGNVGKTPMGTYVTGWVNVSEVTSTTTAAAPKPAATAITVGQKLSLNNTSLYASANAKSASGKKTGTFYVYSTEVVNGRVRITNTPGNVGKTPIGTYVTGWISKSDVK